MDTDVDAVFRTPLIDGVNFLPESPGIYAMLNRVTRRLNIGQAVNVRRRCVLHRSQLRAGTCPNLRMRLDAERYGPDVYFYWVLELLEVDPETRIKSTLDKREIFWVRELGAHDERYGYVSEAGHCRTRGARFRDREQKLMRWNSDKYELLPEVQLYDPINALLLATWIPGS